MDAKIDKTAHFQFDGLDDYGNYTVLILDGRRVIATKQIDGATNKHVTITLPLTVLPKCSGHIQP